MPHHFDEVVRCPTCERHVNANHQGRYSYSGGDYPGDSRQVAFVECPGCHEPFLLYRRGFDPDPINGEAPVDWKDWTTLYPGGTQEIDPAVPKNIAQSYLEARRSFFDASAYTGAAIMCRRTLEGICKHFEAKGGNLKSKLADLRNKDIIDARIHGWADDVLRAVGNEAAHDVEVVISKQDAQDALEFTKAIVEYLYVFEAAFKRFKDRRAKAAAGEAEPAGFSGSADPV